VATSDCCGVTLVTQAIKAGGQGVLMTIIIATSAAVFTGFVVEWSQRQCEAWAFMREKDL
jgi:hypothetical protein